MNISCKCLVMIMYLNSHEGHNKESCKKVGQFKMTMSNIFQTNFLLNTCALQRSKFRPTVTHIHLIIQKLINSIALGLEEMTSSKPSSQLWTH